MTTFLVTPSGLLLFPVAEMYFFRCGNFLGCKAGLSLLLVFFLPRPVFFLPRTGFFPPRTVFSRCLQNAFFLLQRCFCAAARCFFCCFEFFPLRSGIFCCRFFPLRKQLFPAARRFFPAAKRVFFRSDVFFLLRTCVFRVLREDKELENVESYTGRSPLVSWIPHGQIGDKGDQSLKQPSANEKLKRAAVDAATCFNGSGYKRERQKEEEKAEERQQPQEQQQQQEQPPPPPPPPLQPPPSPPSPQLPPPPPAAAWAAWTICAA